MSNVFIEVVENVHKTRHQFQGVHESHQFIKNHILTNGNRLPCFGNRLHNVNVQKYLKIKGGN